MAEVEAQLEANGLPTQFESSANQPEVSHAAANITATISNAEISQLKQDAPGLEVQSVAKPVQPVEANATLAAEPVTSDNDVSLQNGHSALDAPSDAQINGHSTGAAADVNSDLADSSFTDSGLPASIPSELSPSHATTEMALPIDAVTHQAPVPEQAAISDLRTAPHSDALAPEVVANIEAEKHAIDNNADVDSTTTLLPTQAETAASQPEEKDTDSQALPSPPSAPQPEHGLVVTSIETVKSPVSGEHPTDPAPTPAPSAPAVQEDQEMADVPVPVPSLKQVRDREEDSTDEPLAKRVKTDEDRPLADQASFKMPQSPAPVASPSEQSSQVDSNDAVSIPRVQHMKKVISNLKKSNASTAFRLPVDPIALKIPTYLDIVKQPMDLGTIDNRLKHNEYKSVQAFKDDFNQIVKNCVAFNGPDHAVTQQAKKMETSFNNQMIHLPPAAVVDPSKDKKIVKPKIEPIRAPPPRRQSVTAKAPSPKAPSPATFAPDPNGMPLIRRDSALDGRPKRAIVPTKRNSDFGGARPKKKKYELELKFCAEVLKNIGSSRHWQINQYFTHPVDPVALNIPTYFQVIKKPMDLATVGQKLEGGMYEKARDFEEDVRLIFKNCYKFNPEGDYVYQRGQELERLFNQEWAKKQDWITAREPESEPTSVVDEDEDDSDEDDESEEEDQSAEVAKLQAQLEALQSQINGVKQGKKKSPGLLKKKDKKKAKREQPSTKFPGLQKDKSKKPKTKAKPEKDRYVTFAEKQYISNGIAMLPERPMAEALKIIQNSVPALANGEQGEIELDIEEVPNHALLKLLSFVKKYAGPPPDEPKEPEYVPTTSSVKRKSKSMSKHEQEAQIAELKGTLHHYEAGSPDALQSIETGAEDSDDDDSNEESEEE